MAARQHYSVSNAGPVNNTSNATWADIVQLPDFEPDASSTYAFFWSSALQNATNATADAQLRVRFGPAGFETTKATLNLESAATTEYPQLAGMFFHVEGVTPIDVYAEVQIKAETNTNSINAKNGQIVALKLGANDVAAESLTRQTTTSTTPADAVSASFTSDGGDYVVVGYGEFDINIGTVPAYMRLRCEGTNTAELGVRTNDATNLSPGMMVWRFTSVAAGSRTAAFQFRAHTSSTAGITNARILVMRAADFDAVYGAQLTSDSASTSSDAVAFTFTETLTANPHLLLGGWGTSSTTTSTLVTSQVTEAGSDIAESVRRTYNAAQIRFHASGFASLRTPGSGSKTYTLDRVQSGSANIAVGAGSALALIDLGSSGGSAGALSGAATGAGSIAGRRTASSPVTASAASSGSATGRATAQAPVTAAGTGTASAVGRGIVSAALAASATGAGSIVGASIVVSAGVASGAGQGSGAIAGAASSTAALTSTASASGSVDVRSTRAGACAGAALGSASIDAISSASAAVSAAGTGAGAVAGNAIRPAILAASATAIGAVTGRATTASALSVTGSGTASISSASNTTVVGALASAGSSSASIVGRQVVAASLSASAAGQGVIVGTGVRTAAIAALASSSGLAISAASVSAALACAGVGLGQVSGALVNASALSGAGAGASLINGQQLVMATLNGVAVSSGAIVGLSRITLPASEARNVATSLASRTANSNEPARDASTARPSRNALTAAQNRTAVSIRLPR